MDRRTFLAFGLIFLILIGSQALMKKFYGPEPDSVAADSTGVLGREETLTAPEQALVQPETTPADTPALAGATVETPEQPARILTTAEAQELAPGPAPMTILVTTPLYRLALSTAGGRVVSWEGIEHRHHTGGPVELVPEEIPEHGAEAIFFRQGMIDLSEVIYTADQDHDLVLGLSGGSRSLTLRARTRGGLEIRKILTFNPETYGYQVDFMVAAADEALARQSLDLLGSPEDFRFAWNQGISPTERVQRMELPSLRGAVRVGDDYHYKKRNDLKKSAEKATGEWHGSVHFAGLQTRYFTVVGIVPQELGEVVEGTVRLSGHYELEAQSWAIQLPAQRGAGDEIASARLEMYIGPQEANLLAVYGQGLERAMDLGWSWIRPLSVVVLKGMELMHRWIPNYGLIIIIFSILTKLMFYPLTKTSTESMKRMQEVQPKLKALQEKYKNDKEKLNQATMELYRQEKVNPLAGCLPLLLQSPVFIALYQALSHTISLRGQPFVLWMNDLSQPDAIAQLPFALPFLGSDLNVLPILMSVAMYFQTKLTPTSGGGQMAMMNTMMPLFMVFIFYNMPSGLVLYWLVNTIMQAYQSWRIHQTAAPQDGGVQKA